MWLGEQLFFDDRKNESRHGGRDPEPEHLPGCILLHFSGTGKIRMACQVLRSDRPSDKETRPRKQRKERAVQAVEVLRDEERERPANIHGTGKRGGKDEEYEEEIEDEIELPVILY